MDIMISPIAVLFILGGILFFVVVGGIFVTANSRGGRGSRGNRNRPGYYRAGSSASEESTPFIFIDTDPASVGVEIDPGFAQPDAGDMSQPGFDSGVMDLQSTDSGAFGSPGADASATSNAGWDAGASAGGSIGIDTGSMGSGMGGMDSGSSGM